MAYKIDATTFDANIQGALTMITVGFNLVDDAVIDPETGKPTVLASHSVSVNVQSSAPATTAKTIIAQACLTSLQSWYGEWTAKKNRVVDWLTSNEAALETYLNTNMVF